MGSSNISESWIKARIAELVAYPIARITNDSKLRDDIGLDSSDMMFIQLCIEKELGMPLTYDEELQIHSFGDLMAAIDRTLPEPV